MFALRRAAAGPRRAVHLLRRHLGGPARTGLSSRRPSRNRNVAERSTSWYTAIRTFGVYDDVDLSATFRFLEGRLDDNPVRAGFSVRLRHGACYVPYISATGTFGLGAIVPRGDGDDVAWDTVLPRSPTSSLDTRPGAENRLRVVLLGDRLQLWINGLLHVSLRDDRLRQGYAEIMVNPVDRPSRVAWSHLVLAVPG